MATFQQYLQGIKSEIREVEAPLVRQRRDSAVILDVREHGEWVQGHIPGAQWLPRSFLELRVEDVIRDRDQAIFVYCAAGTRSVLAARSLNELGYTNVASLVGGFDAWKRAGFPFDVPAFLTPEQEIRYSRHTMLPEVGVGGQLDLLGAKVLCVGAGGLGSPSALYMAAAGIGTIGIVDDDIVDASNLQRQILHSTDRLGMPKVESASLTLEGVNPDVEVIGYPARLSSENIMEILPDYDVVIDGADNFQTRYLVNDAALRQGIPVIHASIYRFEGQLAVFSGEGAPCYRCLYPEPPPPEDAPSCAEAGVFGVLPGVLGVLQATEALKLILGVGTPLTGRLLTYDALATKFREIKLQRDPQCPTCGESVDRSAIELIDYAAFCRAP